MEPVAWKDWFCHFLAKNFSVLFLTVELVGTFPVLLDWSPSFAYNYVVKFADLVQLPISAVVHRALSGEYNWQTLVGGCESSDHFSIFSLHFLTMSDPNQWMADGCVWSETLDFSRFAACRKAV